MTTPPPSRTKCHEIWEPKPPGTLWATPGLLRDCFTHHHHNISVMELGHLLTRSGLTYPEVSSKRLI